MRPILAIAIVCLFSGYADAQLLKRVFQPLKQVGPSSCPGGICPTAPAAMSTANQQPGHWSFPGTIESHLEGTHGVATAGMSRQEKLNLHDSLHEGAATNTVVSVPRANYVKPFASHFPSMQSSSGGGSSGGSSGEFAVGKMYKGEMVTSIGDVQSESKAIDLGGRRRDFRETLLEKAKQAQVDGEISESEYKSIQRASRIPGVPLLLESRAKGTTDWVAFIKEILPLILELIKLFSAGEEPTAMQIQKVFFVSSNTEQLPSTI